MLGRDGPGPYPVNKNDTLVFGYENPRSLAIKCQYILRSKTCWEVCIGIMTETTKAGDLRHTVYENLIERKPFYDKTYRVLVLTESAGQHKAFSDAALKWLVDESKVQNLQIQVLEQCRPFGTKRVCWTVRILSSSWTFRLIHGPRRRSRILWITSMKVVAAG